MADRGKFLRQITIDVAVDPNARPAIGNKPPATVTGTMADADLDLNGLAIPKGDTLYATIWQCRS